MSGAPATWNAAQLEAARPRWTFALDDRARRDLLAAMKKAVDPDKTLFDYRREDFELGAAWPVIARAFEEVKRGLGVYPVRDGRVLEQAALMCPAEHLEDAMRGLEWPEPDARDEPPDWPWLLSWLHAPKRKGRYLVLEREARAVIT